MAKNYRTSNYGLNKNSKGIVYKYADGTTLKLTFEKISADDPNFTRDDFENGETYVSIWQRNIEVLRKGLIY